jgi:group I intron endonuclease
MTQRQYPIKSGVYRIRNLITGDVYIGSTSTRGFNKRFSDHKYALQKGNHHSIILQRAWNKYKAHSFVYEVILYCSLQDCVFYEQIVMDCYQPRYNINPIAGSRLDTRHTQATKDKIRIANIGKKYSKEVNKKKGRIRKKSIEERQKISNGLSKYYLAMQARAAKLSIENVIQIKKLIQQGWHNKELSAVFGVKPHTISAIRHEKTWRNIHV